MLQQILLPGGNSLIAQNRVRASSIKIVVLFFVLVGGSSTIASPQERIGKQEVVESNGYTLPLPLGLQAGAAYIPEDNPLSAEKIELGKLLYFDPRLSADRTVSCASCHNPYHGFSDAAPLSGGVGGKMGRRNSPTIINRLFSAEQFWDGRANGLEEQVHSPLTDPNKMAMPSHEAVVKRVASFSGYRAFFARAFGNDEITVPRIAQAIATYKRTVVSGNSPYDRYMAGDSRAMSPAAVRGMELFNTKANCKGCHVGFNFTDESYHNLGIGWDPYRERLVDIGRFAQTKFESDKGAFKTPTLRNIALTAPYMHNGTLTSLKRVVEFYNQGGRANPWLSKEIEPLHLTAQEADDLVQFLHALTGEVHNVEPPLRLPG